VRAALTNFFSAWTSDDNPLGGHPDTVPYYFTNALYYAIMVVANVAFVAMYWWVDGRE
jgi:hypothetical protein